MEVAPGTGTVEIGHSLQLTATPKDASGNKLYRFWTWTSSDPAVASVNGQGVVTGVSEGTAIIRATSEGAVGAATVEVISPGVRICSEQSQIPHAECWALVRLYEETNGRSWERSTWWLENTTPCTWQGVTCEGGSVSHLELGDNGLWGGIPHELGHLSDLEILHLFDNQLTGGIPQELGGLSFLKSLVLSFNGLAGEIPSQLGDLAALEELDLAYNQLTGPIPPELGKLSNLFYLSCRHNKLSGSIPPELGNLSGLAGLFLISNLLTGGIPAELGSLSKLQNLWLQYNHLTGTIPSELGNLKNLSSFKLFDNYLSGTIPLTVAQMGGRIQNTHGVDHCDFRPGNSLSLPDADDSRAADLDGDGFICGVRVPPSGA